MTHFTPLRTLSVAAGLGVTAALATAALAGTGSGAAHPASASAPTGADKMDVFANYTFVPGQCAAGLVQHERPDVVAAAPDYLATPGESVKKAWSCGGAGGGTPFLMLASQPGVVVSFEDGWENVDVDKKWADWIADSGDPGARVGHVHGQAALIAPAVSDDNQNEVLFVAKGQLVRVTSNADVPIGRLVGAANSINPAKPVR